MARAGTLLMDLALLARCRQIGFPFGRAVGTVGIHRALAGFGGARLGIQEFVEDLAVMDVRGCDRVVLDQLGGRIGVDGVLVAVVGFVVLLGTAGVGVFLPALGGLLGVIPTFGNLTRFDRGVCFPGIPLARGFDECGIDHVPGLGHVTALGELLIEAGEQHVDQSEGLQALMEHPDRLGVGNPILQVHAEKPHETEPIPNRIVDGLIREVIEMLQNQHPEHEDAIERLRAGVTLAGLLIIPDEVSPKGFEVDLSIERDQRIARRRQLGGAVFEIKQSRVALAKQGRSLGRWLMTVFSQIRRQLGYF